MTINGKYKDSLFRKVFNNKKDVLSLYNALNNSEYTDVSLITINTIEDAIFIGYKNDISFIINSELNLYEHQSSINYNMPLRGLIYFAELYKGYIEQNNLLIYNEKMVKLPYPRYVVFYNGTDEEPEQRELKLSDAFIIPDSKGFNVKSNKHKGQDDDKPCLEVTVQVLNINYGFNNELMEKCHKLMEYSKFIMLVRRISAELYERYTNDGKSINRKEIFTEAVILAINEAIRDNILKDILSKNKAEVTNMLLTEFDEKAYIEGVKQQSYEAGEEHGMIEGEKRGMIEGEKRGRIEGEAKLGELISRLLRDGRTEDLSKVTCEKERERLYREYDM